MKRIIWLSVLCGVLGGCASQPPRWAGQMWQEHNRMYFTGVSNSCIDVACAYRQSYEQALASIAQYIGSQISVHTQERLDNNGAELEMNVELIARQLELEQVQVEKFNSLKQQKKWTGYILVSVGNRELEQARTKWRLKQQERIRRRQIVLQPEGKRRLVTTVAADLRSAGFQTGKSSLRLQLIQTEGVCKSSSLQPLFIMSTTIQVRLQDKQTVFEEKGYGLTCKQAYDEAVENSSSRIIRWLEEIL